VEQQITALARAGAVECRRGAAGGCALARPAAEVTVRDIVLAVHGEILDVPLQTDSAAAEAWQLAAGALEDHLSTIDLASLAARQRELDAASAPMYYI